ncbi:MAG TPA: ATP-binding cassette domain-containing protein [Solirubrobacter sp.]|nr:ATP-binding cassette domain-containing protein [Solirubrobacter sp.]
MLKRIDAALARVGLTARRDDRVKTYSLGMRQRLGVARCLLADPELLILDEPMNGLDPAGILEMRVLIRELVDEGRTVLLSSHLLAEVEKTCDLAAIVDMGRIVAQGSIHELVRGEAGRKATDPRGRRSGADAASRGGRPVAFPASTNSGAPRYAGRMRAWPCFGMMSVMTNGDSRSIYVVQRTFTRVRRGYDPEEVDRHLQLVSEWFARSRVGEEARELKHREAAAKGAQLEAEATLEGARLRAAADTAAAEAALEAARAEAERIVATARDEAAGIRESARREGEAAARVQLRDELVAARAEHDRLIAQARVEAEAAAAERDRLLADAREVLAAAQAERERLLAAVDEEVATVHEAAQTEIEAERAAARARVEREVGELASELRANAEEELEAYVRRRRREIDRLAEAARRERFG